jgi:hypothetical protein
MTEEAFYLPPSMQRSYDKAPDLWKPNALPVCFVQNPSRPVSTLLFLRNRGMHAAVNIKEMVLHEK